MKYFIIENEGIFAKIERRALLCKLNMSSFCFYHKIAEAANIPSFCSRRRRHSQWSVLLGNLATKVSIWHDDL